MTKKKPVPVIIEEKHSFWDDVKRFFKYSEVIFLARLGAVSGAVTTFVGGMDFSPLWSLFSTGTDFTPKQVFWIGIAILGTAVTVEMARRRNMSSDPV